MIEKTVEARRAPSRRTVAGRMKSFDATKGFGFMQTEAGDTVMVHSNVLNELPVEWQKAVHVPGTEVSGRLADREGRPTLSSVAHVEPAPLRRATVKMFDAARRFGFLSIEGHPDAHFTATTIERSGGSTEVGSVHEVVVVPSANGSGFTTLHAQAPAVDLDRDADMDDEQQMSDVEMIHRSYHESGNLRPGLGIGFVSRERRR